MINTLEEVYVSSSRFKLSKQSVGQSIEKITSEDIQKNRGLSFAQLLNRLSGITINGSYGQSGSVLSTNIRGGQNRQVLVLIDGIPANDPSQIENNFDLNLLSIEKIEFIEILKGASSVLYGTNASAAVINIVTKSGYGNPLSFYINSRIGTNNATGKENLSPNDFQTNISLMGSHKKMNFSTHFSHQSNDGLSALSPENLSDDFDTDAFEKNNFQLKWGYTFSNRLSLSLYYNLNRYSSDYDESFGFVDANYHLKSNQHRLGINSQFKYRNGSINLNAAWYTNKRSYNSSYPTKYDGQTLNIDIYSKNRIKSNLFSVLGLKYSKSEMDSYLTPFDSLDFQSYINSDDANDNNFDSYANFLWNSSKGLNLNAGVRLNYHSDYGSHFVYSINPFYTFNFGNNYLKIMTSYGTAFISPSLYQLFAPSFGNANLNPQQDATLEFGLEFISPNNFEWEATFYKRNQTNYIDFVVLNPSSFNGVYQNISGETSVHGVETSFNYKGFNRLNLDFNYAFTESKTRQLFRIPKHKINVITAYDFSKHFSATIDYQYTGKRVSLQKWDSEAIILKGYSLLNMGLSYQFGKRWIVYTRISNLLDESYEEAFRYTTLGRQFYFGFSLKL